MERINENDTINLIKDTCFDNDLYIIRDISGKVVSQSEGLFDDEIKDISKELDLVNHDITKIGNNYYMCNEICQIGDKYYQSSTNEVNNLILTKYTDISNMVNKIKELEQIGCRDGLTGLYNYQYLKKKLTDFVEDNNKKVSLCMIDIDNFKQINDTYGHHFGNKTIKNLAEVLKSAFTEKDLVCKYGGDEFIIAIASSNMEEVKNRLEILQKSAKNSRFSNMGLSLSMGVSEWNENILDNFNINLTETDREKINDNQSNQVVNKYNIGNADAAMYYSKKIGGKDCITIYNNEIKNELEELGGYKSFVETYPEKSDYTR